MTKTISKQTARIKELNDAFRQGHIAGGKRLITAGIAALSSADQAVIMGKVRSFGAFTSANDPHGEHDFGAFEHNGERIFWKIDCYSPDMEYGSENPADPAKTVRVLTIMLAEEY